MRAKSASNPCAFYASQIGVRYTATQFKYHVKGFDDRITTEALVTGIASAAVAGLAYNAIIKCKDSDHPVVIMIYFPLMSLPVMGMACLWEFSMPVGTDWIFIGLMGLTAQVAQYCNTIALQSDSAFLFHYFRSVHLQLILHNLLPDFLQQTGNLRTHFEALEEAKLSKEHFSFYTSVASVFISMI
jgi:hypothetical protein